MMWTTSSNFRESYPFESFLKRPQEEINAMDFVFTPRHMALRDWLPIDDVNNLAFFVLLRENIYILQASSVNVQRTFATTTLTQQCQRN